jgi:hypothetical protein
MSRWAVGWAVLAAAVPVSVSLAVPVSEVNVIQTNWVPRTITNLIEVTAPRNLYVTEFRTNWVQRVVTNVVEVTLTNVTTLTLFRTNVVDRYVTNWTTVAMTNWNTLTLTNWETVVVTKTNWVRQPMVNVVEVNAPAPAESAPPPAPAPSVAPAPAPAASAADVLLVDVVRLNTTAADNRRELQFSVRLAADAAAPLLIEQWRVERADAAVLFYAQTQEFKRALPPGRYLVEVRARRDAGGPLLTVRRTIEVTGDTVVQR